MGNRSICCAAENSSSFSHIQSNPSYQIYAKRNRSIRLNTETYQSSDFDNTSVEENLVTSARSPALREKAQSFNLKEMLRIDTEVLTHELGESGVTHFGFAQRKYVGFRCKYEYDIKCLLIATEKAFCMVTYKLNASYE